MSVADALSKLNRQPGDPQGWVEPLRIQSSYGDLQGGWRSDILAAHKDTGWRNITPLLDPFWTPLAQMHWLPTLAINRENNRVTLEGRLGVATGGITIAGYTLIFKPPVGFRATDYACVGGVTLHESDTHIYAGGIGSFTDAANIEARFATDLVEPVLYTDAHLLVFETSWTTRDAWPVTIPGTPLGLARPDLNKPNDTQE